MATQVQKRKREGEEKRERAEVHTHSLRFLIPIVAFTRGKCVKSVSKVHDAKGESEDVDSDVSKKTTCLGLEVVLV
jgi:hypothetical protein